MVKGTKTCSTNASNNLQIFSASELKSLASSVGASGADPVIAVTNGNYASAGVVLTGVVITNGNAVARLDKVFSGSVKVNYAVSFRS